MSNIFECYPLEEIEKLSPSYPEAYGIVQLEAGTSLDCSLLATGCFLPVTFLVGPTDASNCTDPFASLYLPPEDSHS